MRGAIATFQTMTNRPVAMPADPGKRFPASVTYDDPCEGICKNALDGRMTHLWHQLLEAQRVCSQRLSKAASQAGRNAAIFVFEVILHVTYGIDEDDKQILGTDIVASLGAAQGRSGRLRPKQIWTLCEPSSPGGDAFTLARDPFADHSVPLAHPFCQQAHGALKHMTEGQLAALVIGIIRQGCGEDLALALDPPMVTIRRLQCARTCAAGADTFHIVGPDPEFQAMILTGSAGDAALGPPRPRPLPPEGVDGGGSGRPAPDYCDIFDGGYGSNSGQQPQPSDKDSLEDALLQIRGALDIEEGLVDDMLEWSDFLGVVEECEANERMHAGVSGNQESNIIAQRT